MSIIYDGKKQHQLFYAVCVSFYYIVLILYYSIHGKRQRGSYAYQRSAAAANNGNHQSSL